MKRINLSFQQEIQIKISGSKAVFAVIFDTTGPKYTENNLVSMNENYLSQSPYNKFLDL